MKSLCIALVAAAAVARSLTAAEIVRAPEMVFAPRSDIWTDRVTGGRLAAPNDEPVPTVARLQPVVRFQNGSDQFIELLAPATKPIVEQTANLRVLNPLVWLRPLPKHGRLRADYGTNFDDLERYGLNVIVDSGLPVVGIDGEVHYFRHADPLRRGVENLWTGDMNLIARFRRIRYLDFRTGVGVGWLYDKGSPEFGWNTTWGFDFNLKGPLLVSMSVDYGDVGGDGLLRYRVSAGLDLGRFELFTGWDYQEMHGVERKTAMVGVGMWY